MNKHTKTHIHHCSNIIWLVLLTIFVLSLSGCTAKKETFYISKPLVSGKDAFLDVISYDHDVEMVLIKGETKIKIRATKKEAAAWAEEIKSSIEQIILGIQPEYGFTAKVSEDYRTISIAGTDATSLYNMTETIKALVSACERIQIFDGNTTCKVNVIISHKEKCTVLYAIKYPKEEIEIPEDIFEEHFGIQVWDTLDYR